MSNFNLNNSNAPDIQLQPGFLPALAKTCPVFGRFVQTGIVPDEFSTFRLFPKQKVLVSLGYFPKFRY